MENILEVKDRDAQKTIDALVKAGQGHIFKWWDRLSQGQKDELIAQIKDLDLGLLKELIKDSLKKDDKAAIRQYKPADVIPVPENREQIKEYGKMELLGAEYLRQGRIACFVVAGGQSTRLGYDLPKGTYQVGPITNKSLFQFHAEKILAMDKKYNTRIPWYIMTSQYNSSATKKYFQEHGYFGLSAEDVFFMEQGMLPSIAFNGKLMLDSISHVAMNPDGHGGVIRALERSRAIEDMRKRKIEQVFYFQVDNAFVKIADPASLGYHIAQKADMTCKVVRKTDPEEKIGVIVEIGGKPCVIEYSELSREDMYARDASGSLKYSAGSIAIHIFSVDFLSRLTGGRDKLPYHIAKKKIKYLDQEGKPVVPQEPNGIKFETFIFDALEKSGKSLTIETRREEEFSPLKNKTGADSAETVRRDLLNLYGGWLEAAGVSVPKDREGNVSKPVEISPLYALTKEDFVKKAPKNIVFDKELCFE